MDAPALFVSHGAPTLALEPGEFGPALESFARGLPALSGLVVFSAHFQEPGPIRIVAAARPPLIYDFGGFPDAMYRLTYPAPGDPALAEVIAGLLRGAGVASIIDRDRGWDHGLWVPLRLAFPEARIPVVEASLPPGVPPPELLAIGAALAPLRSRGVAVVGSGGIVHNLARVRFSGGPVDPWAAEFDAWVAGRIGERDFASLAAYRSRGPHADLAVPSAEHFDPLFVTLGASRQDERATTIFEGFQYGNISLRSLAFGA